MGNRGNGPETFSDEIGEGLGDQDVLLVLERRKVTLDRESHIPFDQGLNRGVTIGLPPSPVPQIWLGHHTLLVSFFVSFQIIIFPFLVFVFVVVIVEKVTKGEIRRRPVIVISVVAVRSGIRALIVVLILVNIDLEQREIEELLGVLRGIKVPKESAEVDRVCRGREGGVIQKVPVVSFLVTDVEHRQELVQCDFLGLLRLWLASWWFE